MSPVSSRLAMRTYQTDDIVDFVIVGSGSAGGILAKELSTNGHSVVVLEQGPWRTRADFTHDEFGKWMLGDMCAFNEPQTFRTSPDETAGAPQGVPPALYARTVGGSSVHYTANFWRLHPSDFNERSRLGPVAGADLQDWPITYDDLEPYYTKVDWEIGVSGAPGPFDPPRSRPYPVPPLPVKSSGVLFERAARKLGLHPQPAPMAILSQPHNGRGACQHCGYCMMHGCEYGAKSSTLEAMIPKAVDSGNCEVRANCAVLRVELGANGKAEAVVYVDGEGVEHRQRGRAIIVSANGAETTRLLLMSENSRFPNGLANSSGLLGRNLMFNGQTAAYGTFDEPLNEYKSVQVTRIIWDYYETDLERGFHGGGGMDARMSQGPILFGAFGMPEGEPFWGAEYARNLHHMFTRTFELAGHTTSLPVATNQVDLDPEAKDSLGRPALRITYMDHPDDIKTMQFFLDKSMEILDAAGAKKKWNFGVGPTTVGAHLLGTARMGRDPMTSVVDIDHQTHDVPNLFLCDGSSMVTSGRGQPTMTIMALAFRAADRIRALAAGGALGA